MVLHTYNIYMYVCGIHFIIPIKLSESPLNHIIFLKKSLVTTKSLKKLS